MDTANLEGQGQGISPSPVLTQPSQEVQKAPVQAEERLFKQSEVNDIVKKAKHEAEERYSRLMTQQPEYAQRKYGDVNSLQPSPGNQNAAPDENHYRKIAAEEAQRLRDQWTHEAKTKAEAENAQRIVQNFWNKISTGKDKYQDFDAVTGDIEYRSFPNTVQLLSDYIDNAQDVLYELGKDRLKMWQLESLANTSPRDALVHAQRLAQSIKDNEKAANVKLPREPLSQMRPSNTGTDNGAMSVKDYRNKYRV